MINHKLFQLKKYNDNRGLFYESFSKDLNLELKQNFVQDNISYSIRGVVRGLHYQWDEPMGKLIHVPRGYIIDHIVDIRKDSDNYGTSYKFELSDENSRILWVPPGYAHGFEALQDSVVMYKCTNYYNQLGEGCISFFDKNLNLNLTMKQKDVIISEKDKNGLSWEDYTLNPKF